MAMILILGKLCSVIWKTNKRFQFTSCLGTGRPSSPLQQGENLRDHKKEPENFGTLGRQTSIFGRRGCDSRRGLMLLSMERVHKMLVYPSLLLQLSLALI